MYYFFYQTDGITTALKHHLNYNCPLTYTYFFVKDRQMGNTLNVLET